MSFEDYKASDTPDEAAHLGYPSRLQTMASNSGTSIQPDEIKRFEVTEVYAHPQANVDIVLVHGLNGHPQKTWTAKNGVFWPTALLPATLKNARVRILVYGYNADVYAFGSDKSASSDMIHQHAQTLVNSLAMERESEDMTENPILWIAHSLGGILLKRALEYSNDLTSRNSSSSRSIFVATYGIIFLGTPHTGSDHAKMGLILQSICNAILPKSIVHTEPRLVQTLLADNETLQNINTHFLDIYQQFQIDFVHEGAKTELTKGFKDFVVDQRSASPQLPGVRYYGIEADHSHMCKFESKNAPGYLNVATTIKAWVNKAPPIIEQRFVQEREAQRQAIMNEMREKLSPFTNNLPISRETSSITTTSDISHLRNVSTSMIQSVASIEPETETRNPPYFVKPHGFRPNSIFVGRKDELATMHKMLFDKKRREDGTSAVLLQSLPGGGKTHLARQYVYDHLEEFPGGIFWVRAKSQEMLAASYWDIARTVPLNTSTTNGPITPPDPTNFISIVKEWFEVNHDWLLVLDGIHFDHGECLTRFLPDSKDSSLIYTSTEWNVVGDHHFLNPQVIKLPLLSAREAQDMFLLELNKTDPTTDDLKNSMELVQRMEFLPVVIHAGSQRLKFTEEPLAKFARHYATGPKLRGLDSYKEVVDQLESAHADEALDLIRILCFFSGHIPVEMIVLGLKALQIPVEAYESISGRSLNNTFKILNRFALIDRSEHNVRSSQSSRASGDGSGGDVDMVQLHSVVQDFFIDSLKADRQLPLWLKRATELFCKSYDTADMRIQSKSNSGFVADYRSYEIHGTRLMQHIIRNEKRFSVLQESHHTLDSYLKQIKDEIERRTRESSQELISGRSEIWHSTIFDRTSSSSDYDPETPGVFERQNFDLTGDNRRHESPIEIRFNGRETLYEDEIHRPHPPPYPTTDDAGYDGDRDEVMTERPPQHESPQTRNNDGWPHHVRRQHSRDALNRGGRHRTIEAMERTRYHDRAGAWRAVNARVPDPRLSHTTVKGELQTNWSRPSSRDGNSERSRAQAVLTRISQNNLPQASPKRKRQSSPHPLGPPVEQGLWSGQSPVTAGNAFSPSQVNLERRDSSASRRSLRPLIMPSAPFTQGPLSAVEEPHAFSSPASRPQGIPVIAPTVSYVVSASDPQVLASTYGLGINGNATPQYYPRQTGPLPIDYVHDTSRIILEPSRYPSTTVQQPPSVAYAEPATQVLVSYQNSLTPYANLGYTSQPMSRDTSYQSNGTAAGLASNRQPSLAASEPIPQLPAFLPNTPPTSYQQRRDSDAIRSSPSSSSQATQGRLSSFWPSSKSPRLTYARAALIERVEDWPPIAHANDNVVASTTLRPSSSESYLVPASNFNPTAPSFMPRTRSQPPLSLRPLPPQSPLASISNVITSDSLNAAAVPMSRSTSGDSGSGSGSGGVRVGSRIIAFGEAEPIDVLLARRRAQEALWRERAERNIGVPREMSSPEWFDGEDYAGAGVTRHEALLAGRRRGVSSPERRRRA